MVKKIDHDAKCKELVDKIPKHDTFSTTLKIKNLSSLKFDKKSKQANLSTKAGIESWYRLTHKISLVIYFC